MGVFSLHLGRLGRIESGLVVVGGVEGCVVCFALARIGFGGGAACLGFGGGFWGFGGGGWGGGGGAGGRLEAFFDGLVGVALEGELVVGIFGGVLG